MAELPDFVHLRVHSHYSLLSATGRVGALVEAAAADGQRSLALTDSGNLFGAVELFKKCTAAGLRPILGMATFVAGRSRLEPSGAGNPTQDLTLLAANNVGWDNLKRLSTAAHLEGFHYRPRIDKELLAAHKEGLIVLSGSITGEIPQMVLQGDLAGALEVATAYRDLLGPQNFYLEVMRTGYEPQERVNEGLVQIAERSGIPLVATNDVHYLTGEDWVAQDVMLCVRNGKAISDTDRFRMGSRELYFRTREEMARLFEDLPEALANTVAIAERCQVTIDFGTYHVPVFDPGTGESPEAAFRRLCHEGLSMRYGEPTPEMVERLEYEMGIIESLGFVSYFLITQDFIVKSREMGIPVGPGRGSAAGSIVAYALTITDIDPLRYNLIFERFLNAGRVSMPDIDIDFCGLRREEVIDYVRQKYGSENVSQIITFGTMASRGVLRDVGRALQVPLGEIDKIAKKVPQGPGASLQAALDSDKELQDIRKSDPTLTRLFDLGLKLEGLARHSSVHAAGVVIADRPLADYVPLCKNGDEVSTQWQMTELEEVGLLKMDFLGLKTLTILTEGVRLIKEVHGIDIALGDLPLDDQATFDLMTRGDTLGVFQLESQGMRELLGRLKPDSFEDVIAVLALYRPGPLGSGMVDMFCRRKHGEDKVDYPHADTAPILEETYGVIVYQEQVMRIANVIGGFSMNDADNLRKAMGKKKPEVMARFKDQFVDGAKAKNYQARFATELFETMEFFAGYGFNKSHSAAYALLTWQTAYLKAHYRVEFQAANLTVESSNSDKVREYVDESRREGIGILPPDVNHSPPYFGVEGRSVRFGLGAIKGVGSRLAAAIAEERRTAGPFASLEDLCERLESTLLNKGAMEALAKAGALDGLGSSRRGLFDGIEGAMRASAMAREDKRRGQGLLFAAPAAADGGRGQDGGSAERASDEWPEMERLANEKEALGFYLSGHPFEKRGRFLVRLAGGQTSADVRGMEGGQQIRLAGMITAIRIMQIRSGRNAGQKMARFLLEDLDGQLPVTCFARTYQLVKDLIVDDAIVLAAGRVDAASEEPALLLDELALASRVIQEQVGALVLNLDAQQLHNGMLDKIAAIAEANHGAHRLFLDVTEGGGHWRIRTDNRFAVAMNDHTIDTFAALVGPENLSFTRG